MPILTVTASASASYAAYCEVVSAAAGVERAFDLKIPPVLFKLFGEARAFFSKIAEEFRVPLSDIAKAFRSKDLFLLLKGVGFSLSALVNALTKFTSLLPQGLTALFKVLTKNRVFQALQDGAMSVDEFLDSHPILRKLAGPALAGFLLWIWLNMSFVGDFSSDFDVTLILDALKGRFSVRDLFVSPQGLAMLALLFSGVSTGAGVAWLGSSAYNLMLAFLYTGAKKARDSGLAAKIKAAIPRTRLIP